MVDAVLLILREVLEAALILSMLLVLSNKLQLSYRWSLIALACGFLGSWLEAKNAYAIAEAFDGIGQELFNSALLLIAIFSIMLLTLMLFPLAFANLRQHNNLTHTPNTFTQYRWLAYSLLVTTVSCSITREGSEIWIYLSSFLQSPEMFYSAVIGSVIGAGIGVSLGAITYYLLAFMTEKFFLPTFIAVITLVIGGLSMQIATQLMQIGWLESTTPLWDTSFIISERSWLGELLYALIGYDAKPTAAQGIFYVLTIAPILVTALWYLGAHWYKCRFRVKNHA